ncbi:MAG: PEGA domain-containing protein [bacterium]|nr:PEGA domain-containing protein [bacterium]
MKSSSYFPSLTFAVLVLSLSSMAGRLVAQDTGHLRTRVKPAVAGVFVDGQYKGTASQFQHQRKAIPLAPGTHKVELIDPRYETHSQTVTIEAGKTETIRQHLRRKPLPQPPFGKLKIKNGDRSAVYINNQYFGQADEFNGPGQGLLLKPGEYFVRIVPAGGGTPREEKIKIEANRSHTITM